MTDSTSGRSGGGSAAPRQFRPSRGRRVGDAVISLFIRAGLVPRTYLLTTTGRTSGRPRTNPVTVVEHDDKRWLVAPYGVVSWVRNVRVNGRVQVRRRFDRREYTVRAASAQEAGPVLKKYVAIARPTRPYFQSTPDAPVADFVAEAGDHPVYELVPLDRGQSADADSR